MYQQVIVNKGRTTKLQVGFGFDISGDTFFSEIREEPNRTSTLIVEWTPSFATDGTDGELILTIDDSVSGPVTKSVGYMDIKRVTGGEPVSVFDEILEVLFKESVTE